MLWRTNFQLLVSFRPQVSHPDPGGIFGWRSPNGGSCVDVFHRSCEKKRDGSERLLLIQVLLLINLVYKNLFTTYHLYQFTSPHG